MANYQIQPAANIYAYGMVVQWASVTSLTVSAGQVRASNNSCDLYAATALTLDATTNGANGLDTGSLANATWYYVYAIGSSSLNENTASGAQLSSTAACILSTSASGPSLPEGYDSYRIIGYALTNGSAQFLKFYTGLSGNNRLHYWDSMISVLANGTATSLTAVSAAAAAPAVDYTVLKLNVQYTPATANDKVSLAVFGSASTTLPGCVGAVATKINSCEMNIVGRVDSGALKFQYINSASSGDADISVVGFEYSL